MYYSLIAISLLLMPQESFKASQLKKARVKAAYDEKEKVIQAYFEKKGLSYNGFHLFIRAFKKEGVLEAWVRNKGETTYSLLQTYAFCATSGVLGPKRREGDLQIPEGVYHVNHFNPESTYHLSLGVSYPNKSDRILGDPEYPGSAIYIHGNCVTIGCIPITDGKIKELYLMSVEARNNGQTNIPIHIYPFRMDPPTFESVSKNASDNVVSFWKNLKPVFEDFERSRQVRIVTVDSKGEYLLSKELL